MLLNMPSSWRDFLSMTLERNHVAIPVILLAFLFLLIIKRVTHHLRDPLRNVPGPFWGRFTRLWYLRAAMKKRLHETFEELHQKYGVVVRLAPDLYSIGDLDVARQLYAVRTPFEKTKWYTAFTEPGSLTIFTDRNNLHCVQQRRQFTASYSLSTVIGYENLFDECLQLLCKRIEQMNRNGCAMQMDKWLRLFAFDAIGQITFGETFGGLETETDSLGISSSTKSSAFYGLVVGIIPEFHKWIWKFLPSVASEKAVRTIIEKQISKKQQSQTSGDSRMSFVDVWLSQHEKQEDKMTLKDISLGIGANLAGGSETLSQTMCTIIYLLFRNPRVLKKVQIEIDTAMAKQSVRGEMIRYNVAKSLTYLQAVIKESMRLYPVVGSRIPRIVPEGGVTLAGYFFREGVAVGFNPWSTRQNTKFFGEDASIFRPERWLGPEDEVKRNERYHIPFSMGTRSCLGKNIAMLEISKTIAQIIHSFSFTIKAPTIGNLRYHNLLLTNIDTFVCGVEIRQPSSD